MQEIEIEVARITIKEVGMESWLLIQDVRGGLYQGRDVMRKTGDGYFTEDAITAHLIVPGDRIMASVSQVRHGYGESQTANMISKVRLVDPAPDAKPSFSRMRGNG